jgi:hypothetical protein
MIEEEGAEEKGAEVALGLGYIGFMFIWWLLVCSTGTGMRDSCCI